jgi:EAL domain-containing protein (putative c-di-GMP-specific phosphodiesterase class I)
LALITHDQIQAPNPTAAQGTSSPSAIVWMFAVIVLCLMILANFSFGLLSSMRAYVGGESLWSKAQKDAVFHLQKYAASHSAEDLRRFRTEIAVPMGDYEARLEMDKPNPDIRKVRQGFIRGGNHPDDVAGMSDLYRRFRWVSYMKRPIDFISLAEETGLIVPIGEWVLATACAQNKAWRDQGLMDLGIAVNLSARQFLDTMLLSRLTRIIEASGLDPSSLELEITESVVMSRGDCAVAVLEQLKSIGVRIAIDDFGTGYSSLAYLKRFPIDTIKVDRSFIRDIPADLGDMKIARAIIAMAHALRLKVVAEGVENAEQLKFLRAERCDAVQGYFLSRPLPAAEIAEALRVNRLGCVARVGVPA